MPGLTAERLRRARWLAGYAAATLLSFPHFVAGFTVDLGVLLAWVWVGPLDAPLLRAYFVPGSYGTASSLALPYNFSGVPLLVSAVLALVLSTTAGIVSVWRSSTVSPSSAMKG